MVLYMHIAVGQEQTTHGGQSFHVNRKALSLWLFITSFKKISSTADFMHIFMILYMYIAPVQGQITR